MYFTNIIKKIIMHKYIRPLSKTQVAEIFEISVKTFISWVDEYPTFKDELLRYGDYSNNKLFTQKQVEVIWKYLGIPNDYTTDNYKELPIRAYRKHKVAQFYGIALRTLKKMINNVAEISFLNENDTKKYDFNEISLIFEYIGRPMIHEREK
jgi:Domain of unknown function (DUF4248)